MRSFSLGLVMLIAITQNFNAAAETKVESGDPLWYVSDNFADNVKEHLEICKLSVEIAATGSGSNQGNYDTCISEGKAQAKAAFDKAVVTVKKPTAREAFKSYYVTYITVLEGIRPGQDERKVSYEQRQSSLHDKLTEAWTRFEVEHALNSN